MFLLHTWMNDLKSNLPRIPHSMRETG